MDERERHNRRVMLQRVKSYWLVGVLEESLHGAELIDLAMSYRSTAVEGSQTAAWEQIPGLQPGDEFDQPLPIGSKIIDVYDEARGTLLIMGEPGAGKTTTLLQLVSDLLQRAELDENHPIPVVFSLASWFGDLRLGDWMVNELSNRYEVPRRLGEKWLREGRLLPLLDGLDEVDKEQRLACARAINNFRQQYLNQPTVVTCRSMDYKALATRLKLESAIVLQPLSLEQIDTYLSSLGQRLAGLRAALRTDETLRELAESPLMLSIMTLAYYRMPEDVAISLGNREEGRKLLFDVYVERMARYRSGEDLYDPDDTVRWLAWLAQQMSRQNRTIFFLEELQPNWLPREEQRRFVDRLRFALGGGLLLLGVLIGLLGWAWVGWPALLVGLAAGLLTGGLAVLAHRLLALTRVNWYRIDTVETLNWSWPWAWLGGAIGMLAGMIVGAGISLPALRGNLAAAVPWVLNVGLLGGASQVLENALVTDEMKMRTTPGQGILRSGQNGRLVGGLTLVGTAVLFALVFLVGRGLRLEFDWQNGLLFALGACLYLGLTAGLIYGGLAAIQHRQLRQWLVEKQLAPPDYVAFLDYAAERNLMRKVGGGYMFVHLLLQDYFKDLGKAE